MQPFWLAPLYSSKLGIIWPFLRDETATGVKGVDKFNASYFLLVFDLTVLASYLSK